MRVMKTVAVVALVGTTAFGLSACGGSDEPEPPVVTNALGIPEATEEDRDAYEPRESTVGDGLGETPPSFDGELAAAAKAAGCTTASFKADVPDGSQTARDHVEGTPDYTQSLPPTSGPHNATWAKFGFYDQAVPVEHLIHDLEHGAVVVYYGTELGKSDVLELGNLWAKRPAYTVFTPADQAKFPPKAVVATAWQRWMVCKPFKASQVGVLERFITTYRGTGPEQNPSQSPRGTIAGLPEPLVFDPKTN